MPFLVLVFLSLVPSPSRADFSDAAIAAISRVESQGFVIDTVSRTFLGRVKIVSHNEDYERETVFHAVTIEVLQDRLTPRAPGNGASRSGTQTQSGFPAQSNGNDGSASSNAESSSGDTRSSTSGSATGRSPQSSSSSESSHSESTSTTNNPDGSTTTTTSSTTTSSASSSASAGN